jgi:uncharacterized protein (DUF362 family)
MNKSVTVSIQRCPSYDLAHVEEALSQVLQPWGGLESMIRQGDRVLLKPNLLFGKPSEKAVTTHPAIVEAVARRALDLGAQVFVGDSPPILSAQRAIHKCGIEDVVRRLGLQTVEFNKPTLEGWRPQIHTRGIATPPISGVLQDMDFVVNLPKLKSHQQMALTGAVKNLFGCVIGRRKAFWHFKLRSSADAFAVMLLALYEKICPGLTVVDSVVAMEGMGPGNGVPKPVGLILAGTDAIAIDRVITELVGMNGNDHFVIRKALSLGFSSANLENISIAGESIQNAKIQSFQFAELTPIGFSIPHLIKGIVKYVLQRMGSGPKPPME